MRLATHKHNQQLYPSTPGQRLDTVARLIWIASTVSVDTIFILVVMVATGKMTSDSRGYVDASPNEEGAMWYGAGIAWLAPMWPFLKLVLIASVIVSFYATVLYFRNFPLIAEHIGTHIFGALPLGYATYVAMLIARAVSDDGNTALGFVIYWCFASTMLCCGCAWCLRAILGLASKVDEHKAEQAKAFHVSNPPPVIRQAPRDIVLY